MLICHKNSPEMFLNQGFLEVENGINLYYHYEGYSNRPCITFLNTLFANSTVWSNYYKRLKEDFNVLTFDYRNQGKSSKNHDSITYESILDDLKKIMDKLEIKKTFLLGFSISTLLSIDFALKYKERINGIVLCSPVVNPFGSKKRKFILKSWLNSLNIGGEDFLFDHLYPQLFGDRIIESGGSVSYLALKSNFLQSNSSVFLKQYFELFINEEEDIRKLKDLNTKVLIIYGENDFFCCKSSIEAVSALIRYNEIEEIKFCGHLPYFESTDLFERIVKNFLMKTYDK